MKNDKVKSVLIGVLAAGLVSMTVAYALLSQRLDIKSTAKVTGGTWDIHFANGAVVENTNPLNAASITTTPTLTNYLIQGLEVELTKPGDTASYTFDIYNSGSIDAKITDFGKIANAIVCTDASGSTSSDDATGVCNNLTYSLTYTDATTAAQTGTVISAGTDIATGQLLKQNQHVNITLTITYNSDSEFIPSDDVTISGLDSYIIYTQN